MKNNTILSRLAKVEQKIGTTNGDGQYRILKCTGPRDMSTGEIVRELGYEFTARTIVVRFVPAPDQPDSPLKDCTRA